MTTLSATLDKPRSNIPSSKNVRGMDMKKLSEIVSKETHKEMIKFLLKTSIPRLVAKQKEEKKGGK